MPRRKLKHLRLPTEEQTQNLMEFARNERVQTSMAALMETPEEWDNAMLDPSAWLAGQGLEVPEGFSAVITKDISFPEPVVPVDIGMPGPDWQPYHIEFTNCRTYWIPVRDERGKLIKYSQETVCFGIEFIYNRQPGPVGGPGIG